MITNLESLTFFRYIRLYMEDLAVIFYGSRCHLVLLLTNALSSSCYELRVQVLSPPDSCRCRRRLEGSLTAVPSLTQQHSAPANIMRASFSCFYR
jgi:hypothetical protein